MMLRHLILLLVAAAILDIPATLAQQRDTTQRRQQLLQRQAKQQEQGVKRKLISRTRVNAPRKQLTTPQEVLPTIPTTVQSQDSLTTQSLTTLQERPRQGATTPLRNEATEATLAVEDLDENVEVATEAPKRSRTKSQPQPVISNSKKPALAKKTEETEKKPVVETIRRYSFENEDGSFTFGYENADGSFKEETRGADCVVRGKYGYVDPDGVRREFSYVSGNPCDPTKNGEEGEDIEEERITQQEPQTPLSPNTQRRPNIPNIPNIPRPAVQPVEQVPRQQVLAVGPEEEEGLLEVLRTPETRPRPNVASNSRIQRPRPVNQRPVINTENDFPSVPEVQPQRIGTTSRPFVVPVNAPVVRTFDFDAEVSRFTEQPRNPAPVPQRPVEQPRRQEAPSPAVRLTGTRSFTSELVFDPSKNQFRTAVVQRIPEAQTEISIRENLLGFVSTTTARPETTETRQTVPTPTTTEKPRVGQQATFSVPADNEEPTFDFNSFGPPRQEVERQQQQQRPQFPVPQTAFNPQFSGFRQQQPQFVPEPPRRNPQFTAPNPFAPGIPSQQFFGSQPFGQAQPQQFASVQATQPQNSQVRAQPRPPVQASNAAAGQIDSFLSSLG